MLKNWGGVQSREPYLTNLLINMIYADIWAPMAFILKVGAGLVSKSEKRKKKFWVGVQRRKLGLNNIHSKIRVLHCVFVRKYHRKIWGGLQKRERYPTNLLTNMIYTEIWACMASILRVGACMVSKSKNTTKSLRWSPKKRSISKKSFT